MSSSAERQVTPAASILVVASLVAVVTGCGPSEAELRARNDLAVEAAAALVMENKELDNLRTERRLLIDTRNDKIDELILANENDSNRLMRAIALVREIGDAGLAKEKLEEKEASLTRMHEGLRVAIKKVESEAAPSIEDIDGKISQQQTRVDRAKLARDEAQAALGSKEKPIAW